MSMARGAGARVVVVAALGAGTVLVLCLALSRVRLSSAETVLSGSGHEARAGGGYPLDVVINEVAWMGTVYSALDEWIELRNNTPLTVSLDTWHLAVGSSAVVALGGEIAPYGFYLLERASDSVVADIPVDLVYSAGLADNGAALTLTNGAGVVIDAIDCTAGWPAGNKNPDYTMERVNPLASHAADNWATNDGITRNGVDQGGYQINGTPRAQNSRYAHSGLSVAGTGPDAVTPGFVFVSQIVLTNTSILTATGVVVTDVLPPGVMFVSSASPVTYSQPAVGTLLWHVGELRPGASRAITIALRPVETLKGVLTRVLTAADDSGLVQTAVWSVPLVPYVRIYALHPWALRADDEAMALVNLGPEAVSVAGWGMGNGGGAPETILPAATVQAGEIMWLADDADAFMASFGFAPHAATGYVTQSVPLLAGAWPGFTNSGGQAVLYDGAGRQVDVLVYGSGVAPPSGWAGPAVSYPYAGFGSSGQILYRRLDEPSGLPVTDTDTAADWANDTRPGSGLYGPVHEGDLYGKHFAYPGWDWYAYSSPFAVTATAQLTVGVAPDNAYVVVASLLGRARASILVEGYTFESVWLTGVLTERIAAGVQVTVLLDGGRISDQELWNSQQIVDAGGQVYFMHNDPANGICDRYTDQHAKFVVVDGTLAAVSSENFGNYATQPDLGEPDAYHLAVFAEDLDASSA